MKNYQVLLYYFYTEIKDPEKLKADQIEICQKLDLKGRIIVASEGINGTLEGLEENTQKYIEFMLKDERFKNIHFKKSKGTGNAFPKLSVKLREDIVSSAISGFNLNPNKVTGKYIYPDQLHDWIQSGKRFFIVDMRNDYEQAVGYFKNSLLAPFKNFRDLPNVLPVLKDLKNETIVTVCTGGVRCEKASGFLVENGFSDVYQLFGGIVSYMEMYPNEDFLGKLYVFDGRITMGFNTDSKDHVVVGKCKFCFNPADKYYDCKYLHCQGKRHFISCNKCVTEYKNYCSKECQNANIKNTQESESLIQIC